MKNKHKQLEKLQQDFHKYIEEIYTPNNKILVYGEGNPNSHIVLVGEAPGEQETIKRRPFVGKAGKNLDEFLETLRLERQDIYITNVVKFRPCKTNEKTGRVSNRPPNREEIELCKGLLYRELELIKPKVVVSLGNTALRTLTQNGKDKIGDKHGKLINIAIGEGQCSLNLFPLYHPASIIYRRELEKVYKEDLHVLYNIING